MNKKLIMIGLGIVFLLVPFIGIPGLIFVILNDFLNSKVKINGEKIVDEFEADRKKNFNFTTLWATVKFCVVPWISAMAFVSFYSLSVGEGELRMDVWWLLFSVIFVLFFIVSLVGSGDKFNQYNQTLITQRQMSGIWRFLLHVLRIGYIGMVLFIGGWSFIVIGFGILGCNGNPWCSLGAWLLPIIFIIALIFSIIAIGRYLKGIHKKEIVYLIFLPIIIFLIWLYVFGNIAVS